MHTKRTLSIVGILLLVMSMVLLISACNGGESGSTDTDTGGSTSSGSTTDSGNDTEDQEDTVVPSPTPEPETLIPEVLAVHPDAYDFEITAASDTYVYIVPMMVKETTEYLLAAQEALGWEKLGNPTIMGHLATLTMKMGDDRLTINLQDNELSETTRVQMLLMQQ
jgi:hypothetical protein